MFIKTVLPNKFRLRGPVIVSFFKRPAALALPKAFLAVYRAVSAWLKRNLAFFTAVRADRSMQGPFPVDIIPFSFAMMARVIETLGR